LRRDLRDDKGRGPRCQQNRSSALSHSPSALPSPVVGASSLARLWYWGWGLSAFPPVETALDAGGDTGAGLKRRSRAKHFRSRYRHDLRSLCDPDLGFARGNDISSLGARH
jgi:hypothetical protein